MQTLIKSVVVGERSAASTLMAIVVPGGTTVPEANIFK